MEWGASDLHIRIALIDTRCTVLTWTRLTEVELATGGATVGRRTEAGVRGAEHGTRGVHTGGAAGTGRHGTVIQDSTESAGVSHSALTSSRNRKTHVILYVVRLSKLLPNLAALTKKSKIIERTSKFYT